jgi:hypothetical protein
MILAAEPAGPSLGMVVCVMAELRMLSSAPSKVRCRQIAEADLEAVADLLREGFPSRARKYWTTGFERMRRRPPPCDAPRFGYVLDVDGALVGVLLLLFTGMAQARPTFNVSSWYVRPGYRGFATLLVTMALRRKDAVYLNTSPIEHSLPILTALGFRPLSNGQLVSALWLSPPGRARVRAISPTEQACRHPQLPEFDLLRDHAANGCISLVCDTGADQIPFIFTRRDIRYAPLGVAQLIWCRQYEDLARLAGPLGRALAQRGAPLVICDANGPVEGLVGRYFPGKSPKFFKGPIQPRINDLAFSEAVIFGP